MFEVPVPVPVGIMTAVILAVLFLVMPPAVGPLADLVDTVLVVPVPLAIQVVASI